MGFVEIKPEKRTAASRTGVTCSLSERFGLMITLSGETLAALGNPPRAKLMLDWAGVDPLLRIVAVEDGPFALFQFGRGKSSRSIRVGWRDEWRKVAPFKALDCLYEIAPGDGPGIVEIELPRELRPVRPSESVRVPGSQKSVSIAKV